MRVTLLLLTVGLIATAAALVGVALATGGAPADSPYLAYNRGCSYASDGALQQAAALLSQAARGKDDAVAARSHYNLGTIAARQAQQVLGDDPVEAMPEQRQEGLALLKQALAHYRDSLELAPYQSDSRYNLELIRLWIGRMETLWAQRDSRNRRRQMSLLEMLEDLQSQQRELRTENVALAEQPDSPERLRMARQLADVQRLLSEEVDTLREKLVRELDDSAAAWPEKLNVISLLSATVEEAITELSDLADEAQQEMVTAVEQLREGPLEEAAVHQALAIELIDEMHLALVPFFPLVNETVRSQRRLIELVEEAGAGEAANEAGLREAAWDQQFVARWCQVLPDKAEQSLQILQAMGAEAESPTETSDGAQSPSPLVELTRCVEKAVEVAPKVQDLTDQAAADLSEQKPAVALPKQQEALALLEQVLALFPESARQAGEDRQAPSHSAGKHSQNEEPSPGNLLGQNRSTSGPKESATRTPAPRQGDFSARHLEAMARQVRERQRQRHVLEKELQHGGSQAVTVEKDW